MGSSSQEGRTVSDRPGIALGGFMGVGKTTVGRHLARCCGLPFVDTDAAIARRHGPISEQFRLEGEAVFRARERALVALLCDGTPRVIATGGGLWVDPKNRALLRRHHLLVVLDAPLDILRARVTGSSRPLWDASVEQRYRERRSAYQDADLVIDTAARSVQEVVQEILSCR